MADVRSPFVRLPYFEGKNMNIQLREYQKKAVESLLWAQTLPGNDLCVLPTGAGKSIVISQLAKELNQPILILQPSKEILEQNLQKLSLYVDREQIGVYSASMNEKTIKFFTFATIQSIYKKAYDFQHFKLVIIDECHLVDPKNLNGMFTKFLQQIGNPKVVGFTATPYRLSLSYFFTSGELTACTAIKLVNRLKGHFWKRIVFNINNHELVDQGFLCPLEYIDRSVIEHDQIPTNVTKSNFDMEAFEQKISSKEMEIIAAVQHARSIAKSILVFCSSVKQAIKLQSLVPGSTYVTGTTKSKERAQIISDFKDGTVSVVFNVGVLTTGFDHPSLDCIVLIRPTRSIALYYQMLGRGVRMAPGKTSCKVIDLTSTVKNLGRVETIKLTKESGKWELESESGSWHNQPLYIFKVRR